MSKQDRHSSSSFTVFVLVSVIAAFAIGVTSGYVIRMPEDEFAAIKQQCELRIKETESASAAASKQSELEINNLSSTLDGLRQELATERSRCGPRVFEFTRQEAIDYFTHHLDAYKIVFTKSDVPEDKRLENWSAKVGQQGIRLLCDGESVQEMGIVVRPDTEEDRLVKLLTAVAIRRCGPDWPDAVVDLWVSSATLKMITFQNQAGIVSQFANSSSSIVTRTDGVRIELLEGSLLGHTLRFFNFYPERK